MIFNASTLSPFALALVSITALAAPAAKTSAAPQGQMVILKDGSGVSVGQATVTEDANGVRLSVELKGAQAGVHGMHVHNIGVCTGPKFESAGSHFNPMGKKHGKLSAEGPHLGDLSNIEVDPRGNAKKDMMIMNVSLKPDAKNTLTTDAGTSLVIHAKADDDKTDPSGNSGDRIYCGVISAPRTKK